MNHIDTHKIQSLLSLAHEIGLGRSQKLIGEEWSLLVGRTYKGNSGKNVAIDGGYFIKVPPEYGSETLIASHDKEGRLTKEVRSLLEGMSVSVDVSTNEEDSGKRLFGTVSEVMDSSPDDKFGVILLMHDQEPNDEGG